MEEKIRRGIKWGCLSFLMLNILGFTLDHVSFVSESQAQTIARNALMIYLYKKGDTVKGLTLDESSRRLPVWFVRFHSNESHHRYLIVVSNFGRVHFITEVNQRHEKVLP
jgi:hypothetical protein